MPNAIRILVFIAAASVIAAATHANVMHAGGYASRDAPLIIALAVLLALGMAFVGVCFNEGRRWQAILLAFLILAGEAYWVLHQCRPRSGELGCRISTGRRVARGPRRGARTRRESRDGEEDFGCSRDLRSRQKRLRIQLCQAAAQRSAGRPLVNWMPRGKPWPGCQSPIVDAAV